MPRRQRAIGARRVQRQLGRQEKGLIPRPLGWLPPKDPPTFRCNPVRRQCIGDVLVESDYVLSAGSLRNRIIACNGLASNALVHFNVDKVAVWGPPGSALVKMSDAAAGVTTEDTGSYSSRGKAGIQYPRNIQLTVQPTTTGNLVSGVCGASANAPAMWMAWVTWWLG